MNKLSLISSRVRRDRYVPIHLLLWALSQIKEEHLYYIERLRGDYWDDSWTYEHWYPLTSLAYECLRESEIIGWEQGMVSISDLMNSIKTAIKAVKTTGSQLMMNPYNRESACVFEYAPTRYHFRKKSGLTKVAPRIRNRRVV